VTSFSGAIRGVNSSVGVFLQGSYKITPDLTFTAGGRYTWDKRRITFTSIGTNLITLPNGPAGFQSCGITAPPVVAGGARVPFSLANCVFTNRAKFDKPSYTIGLDYQATPDNLFYIVHRQGYRTGGLNQRAATTEELVTPFGPETVRDVEIGSKNTFRFDNDAELRVNIAAYYLWYSDIQRLLQRLEDGLLFNTITNAGKAHIKGVELDVSYVPVPGLTISGAYAYSKATYDSFSVNIAGGVRDFSNNRFSNAPVHSGNLSVRVQPELNWSFGSPFVQFDTSAQSSIENTDINAIGGRIGGWSVSNAQVGVDDIGDRELSVVLAVKNIFNREYDVGRLAFTPSTRTFPATGNQLGTVIGNSGPRRTVMLTARYGF
jgi:iron complex outermembrane receptor protein